MALRYINLIGFLIILNFSFARMQEPGSISQAFSIMSEFLEDVHTDIEEIEVKVNATSCICPLLESNSKALAEIQAQQEKQEAELRQLNETINKQEQLIKDIHYSVSLLSSPLDCVDVELLGNVQSGVYRVLPAGMLSQKQVPVYCDFVTPGGVWLVFQRRKDGSVDFERTWNEYAKGFGTPLGEFWLGNDVLHQLTSRRIYKLRIDMEDFNGTKRYAEYSSFYIGSAAEKYQLTVSGYSGDAGDSLIPIHNGMKFSTKDSDNDMASGLSCSQTFRGAWWYNACHASNLNGLYLRGEHKSYADGVEWYTWHGHYYSLKTTEMKIALVK